VTPLVNGVWKLNWNAICGILAALSVGFVSVLVGSAGKGTAAKVPAQAPALHAVNSSLQTAAQERYMIPRLAVTAATEDESNTYLVREYGNYGRPADIPGITPEQDVSAVQSTSLLVTPDDESSAKQESLEQASELDAQDTPMYDTEQPDEASIASAPQYEANTENEFDESQQYDFVNGSEQ
jgi:hypothetical protein